MIEQLVRLYFKANWGMLKAIFSVFSLNGELLVDPSAGDAAFTEINGESFIPACTLGIGQKCRLNFGHDVDSLKYFTMCGLQEGYEPFCV